MVNLENILINFEPTPLYLKRFLQNKTQLVKIVYNTVKDRKVSIERLFLMSLPF